MQSKTDLRVYKSKGKIVVAYAVSMCSKSADAATKVSDALVKASIDHWETALCEEESDHGDVEEGGEVYDVYE